MCLMPLFLFLYVGAQFGTRRKEPPSSCEHFPTESCSSLKACTSRLVLAANEIRSHFEFKLSALVLRRYFLQISSPFQRMSTDSATSKAVLKNQISFKRNSSQLSRPAPDLDTQSFNRETALRSYTNLNF